MARTIAILGTCASDDWFHYQDARHRLDVRLAPPYQQSSLISLAARPVPVPEDLGGQLGKSEAANLRIDLDKSFLARLADAKPDYLIVDLLIDARRGVIAMDGSWVTNSYIINRSQLAAGLEAVRRLNALEDLEAYLVPFTESLRRFAVFLNTELPRCRVILHKARWAEYFVDKDDAVHPFEPKLQMSCFAANIRMPRLEAAFEREIPCDVISIDAASIVADARHIWGLAPVHYRKDYYRSFTEQLRRIIMRIGSNGGR